MMNKFQTILKGKSFKAGIPSLFALCYLLVSSLQATPSYALGNPFVPTTDVLNTGLSAQTGAVSLVTASQNIANLTDITGAYYDSTLNRIVFIGTTNGTLHYNKDDMAIAINSAIFGGILPDVSIDDDPSNPSGPTALVNYTGPIKNTNLGSVLYNSDYKFKQYIIGYDPSGNKITSVVPTYKSVVDRYVALNPNPVNGNQTKFILSPQNSTLKYSSSASSFVFNSLAMKATTQQMNPSNDPKWDQAASNFASDVTTNYDQYAGESPVLTQAKQIAKIVAILKWVSDKGITTDFNWARNYTPQTVTTPNTVQKVKTPVFPNGYSPQGELSFTTANTYLADDGSAAALKTSAQAASTSNQDVTWNFTSGGQQYQAVAVAAGAFKSLGAYSTSVTDLSTPIVGDLPLSFQRRYSSFSGAQNGIGLGWDMVPARLYPNAANATDFTVCNSVVFYTKLAVDYPNGHETFTFSCPSGYSPDDSSFHSKVVQNSDGTAVVTLPNQTKYNFNFNLKLAQILDKNGNAINYTYNTQNGNLIGIGDTHNHSLTISYNAQNLISQIADWASRTVKYAYDGSGRLTGVTDPNGNITNYTYDGNGKLATTKDRTGQVVLTNTYASDARIATSKNAANILTTYAYDNANKAITQTDNNGRTTKTSYDDKARILQQTDPANKNVSYTYGNESLPLTVTDKKGNKQTFTYDSGGNTSSVTFPDNSVINYTFDASNRLTKVLDGRYGTTPKETDYAYDSKGNLTQKTEAGLISKYTYNSSGDQLTSIDPLNHTTTWTRDSFGNPLTQVDALNKTTTFTYDSLGRLTKQTDANNNSTSTTYDSNSNALTTSDSAGITTNTYDKEGRITKVTAADNSVVSYAYNPSGSLSSVTDQLNNITNYGLDSYQNIASKTDALNNTTNNIFDLLNRETQSTTPLGKVSKWAYDASGNITSRTDANNKTTNYTYDTLNRLTKITYPDTKTVTFTYDARGNKTKMVDPVGTSTYTYDNFDRLTQAIDDYSHKTSYTYDSVGNLKTLTYDDGSIVTYNYDADNHMSSVVDWNNHTTSYTYNSNGTLATRTLPNGIVTTYTYDTANRMTGVTHKKGTTTLAQFTYTRNAIGNVTSATESGSFISPSQTINYTYDAAGRLTNATYPNSNTYDYTYDKVGNMLTDNIAHDPSNGTFSDTYAYDKDSKLTNINGFTNFGYDSNGNMLEKPSQNPNPDQFYTYDPEDRLTKLTTFSGNVWNYTYDGLGNRLQKLGSTATERYITDMSGSMPRTIAIASGFGSGGIIEKFLYGLGPISDDGTQYYLEDGLGNLRFMTDSNGFNNGSTSYDPYGNTRSFTSLTQNFNYQQQWQDFESDQYFLRARYYDPSLRRFISKDPVSGSLKNPQTQNPYAYANDNPVNLSDPSGRCIEDFCIGEGALVLAAGTAALESPEGQEVIAGAESTALRLQQEAPIIAQRGTGVIYWAWNSATKAPSYIGKTIDFTRRASQHLNGPANRVIKPVQGLTNIPVQYLRAVEQALIEKYGIANLDNIRNAAKPGSAYYNEFINIGREYIKKAGL